MIRRATIDDYEGLCLVLDELSDFHSAARPDLLRPRDTHGRPRELVEQALADSSVAIFVAEEAGEVAGLVWVVRRTISAPLFRPAPIAIIDALSVRAAWRGQGLGRALMEEAERWAREQHVEAVALEVFDFEGSAVGFYERLGYGTLMRRMHKPVTSAEDRQMSLADVAIVTGDRRRNG